MIPAPTIVTSTTTADYGLGLNTADCGFLVKHDRDGYRIIQHSRNGESFDASHNPDDRPAGDMRLHRAEPRVRNLRSADRHHDLPSGVRNQGVNRRRSRVP